MKVGILGSGDVGQALGKGLVDLNNEVMIGSRTPQSDNLLSWKEQSGKLAHSGTTNDAASFGEIVILATNWIAIEDVLRQVRPSLAGKVVIDVTNPLEFSDTTPPRLVIGHTMSGGEMIQQWLPDSHVVKTLNIINYKHMVQPHYDDGVPGMLFCGNNPSAKQSVSDILNVLGWEDLTDLGDISNSRLMEPLCLLWVAFGGAHKTYDHAFSMLRK